MHFRRTNPLICICNITNSVCQSATWLFQHDINLSLLKKCCYINSKRVAKRELKTQWGQNISEVVQLIVSVQEQYKFRRDYPFKIWNIAEHIKTQSKAVKVILVLIENCAVYVINFHLISNFRCGIANKRPLGKNRRGLHGFLGVFPCDIWPLTSDLKKYSQDVEIILWKRWADKIQLWL